MCKDCGYQACGSCESHHSRGTLILLYAGGPVFPHLFALIRLSCSFRVTASGASVWRRFQGHRWPRGQRLPLVS